MVRFSGQRQLVPFEPDEPTPLQTENPTHGNLLAMMAHSSDPDEDTTLRAEPIEEDHIIAATMPLDTSVVGESGHMDHHRKPIVSIHGKDVDEHELNHRNAA
ncbi:MAG: hypothetical protein JOZ10_01395 [Acidobacteria bacterium]|nr:hypothetical protein [Acidobacteriota bacterium]